MLNAGIMFAFVATWAVLALAHSARRRRAGRRRGATARPLEYDDRD